ncbi:molybdenum metabolism regulator, partial [Myxococcota bacterium]|nr:molybdenum metabolism regulator [Myxococcota bacterium]
ATASAPAKPRDIKADMATAAFIAPSAHVERVSEIGDGVLLICVEVEGRVRVRVLTEGYEPTWNVQFPRELREVGARFVVDEVQPAARGGFYRAKGEARRYEGEG